MEDPSFHKRKCDDSDSVIELLHGVSISHRSKKVRQVFDETSYSNERVSNSNGFVPVPEVDFPVSNYVAVAPVEPIDIDLSGEPLQPAFPASLKDERAIVLYKPVTSPLFPGGPSAGSQVLLNARILPSGVLNASNLLGKKEDELSWLSAPKSEASVMELLKEEGDHPDVFCHNPLAVVPWDSKSPVNVLTSHSSVHLSNENIAALSGNDQTSGVVAMEEDNESTRNFVDSQVSNATISFCYEPWQQYRAPQPQLGSLMWSR